MNFLILFINYHLKGRSFTLKNISENKVGSPAIKGGEAGAYTREEGIYAYFEICEKINVDNWQKKWDNVQQSVYATLEDQWVIERVNIFNKNLKLNYILTGGI